MIIINHQEKNDGFRTSLNSLPSETIHHIIDYLHSPIDKQRLSLVCKSFHTIATDDVVWRPVVQECLKKSPPVRSKNLKRLIDPPAPWQAQFGMISSGRNQATRETWKPPPIYGGSCKSDEESVNCIQSKGKQKENSHFLSLFNGIQSYYELYWLFVRPFSRLLGWWLGDVPSYGMIIRIIFDPAYQNPSSQNAFSTPAFICQKLHLVNRFYGTGPVNSVQEWRNSTGLNSSEISHDGTSIRSGTINVDISLPGVKTEDLWTVTWEDVRKMQSKSVREYKHVARARWRGADQSHHAKPSRLFDDHGELIVPPDRVNDGEIQSSSLQNRYFNGSRENGEIGTDEQQEDDLSTDYMELDGLHEFRPGNHWAQYVNMSALDAIEAGHFNHIPASKRAIRHRCGNRLHTVYLASGAVCTAPVKFAEKACCPNSWSCLDTKDLLSLTLSNQKLYSGPDSSKSGGFGLRLSNFLPLPPIEFPSPALLPLVRNPFENEDGRSLEEMENIPKGSSKAFEEFLNLGTDFTLPTLQMEPCPPYRPWPHLSQPMPDGLRFVPVKSPPREPLLPYTQLVKKDVEGRNRYFHPIALPSTLDPAEESFDWNVLNGLYSMTYGPWGQELIYIRSRILTVHDFAPNDLYFNNHLVNSEGALSARPTGPHGTGHRKRGHSSLEADDENGGQPQLSSSPLKKKSKERIEEGLHWQAEPFIDRNDLELPLSQTEFIKPGCRVIEGIKCTGDTNVPRGSITFRAFSRGPNEDECLAYVAPEPDQARHAPWDGRQTRHIEADTDEEEDGTEADLLEEAEEEARVLPIPATMDGLFRINRRGREGRGRRSSYETANRRSTNERGGVNGTNGEIQQTLNLFPPSPGRIIDCGTGRLSLEGFVNAGCWRRCSIKIVSPDEICVHWQALNVVALAKRLTDV